MFTRTRNTFVTTAAALSQGSRACQRNAKPVFVAAKHTAFGSKERLYEEATETYLAVSCEWFLRELNADIDTRSAFHNVLLAAAREFTREGVPSGCMISLAGTHLPPSLNSVRDTRHQRMELSLDAPVTTDAEDGDERTLDVADKHPDIEQHLVEEARKKMIKHAIDKLPEKQRAAVLLHKYQELDYNEIAKILECSESALKSLLFRAYETLRVELAPLVAGAKA